MTLQPRPSASVVDVLAALRPQLLAVAKDVADKAKKSLDYSLPRPARVEGFNATTGEAIVTVDNDSGPTAAQVITAYPLRPGDRVFVLFVPPHGLLVIGHAKGFPLIANEDDSGLLTTIAVTPSWSTVKTLTLGTEPLGRAYRVVAKTDFRLYSGTNGKTRLGLELGVSLDDGATWAVNVTPVTAAANDSYAAGSVSVSAATGYPAYRPKIRVRAQLAATPTGAYDLANVYTTWTVTPQEP